MEENKSYQNKQFFKENGNDDGYYNNTPKNSFTSTLVQIKYDISNLQKQNTCAENIILMAMSAQYIDPNSSPSNIYQNNNLDISQNYSIDSHISSQSTNMNSQNSITSSLYGNRSKNKSMNDKYNHMFEISTTILNNNEQCSNDYKECDFLMSRGNTNEYTFNIFNTNNEQFQSIINCFVRNIENSSILLVLDLESYINSQVPENNISHAIKQIIQKFKQTSQYGIVIYLGDIQGSAINKLLEELTFRIKVNCGIQNVHVISSDLNSISYDNLFSSVDMLVSNLRNSSRIENQSKFQDGKKVESQIDNRVDQSQQKNNQEKQILESQQQIKREDNKNVSILSKQNELIKSNQQNNNQNNKISQDKDQLIQKNEKQMNSNELKILQYEQNQINELEKESSKQQEEINQVIEQLIIFCKNQTNFTFIFEMMDENDKIELQNQIQNDQSILEKNLNDLRINHHNSLSEIIKICNKILPLIEKLCQVKEIKEQLKTIQIISKMQMKISNTSILKISNELFTYFNKIKFEYITKIAEQEQNKIKELKKLDDQKSEQQDQVNQLIEELLTFVQNTDNFTFIFEVMDENDQFLLISQIETDQITLENNINDIRVNHKNSLTEIIKICNKIIPMIEIFFNLKEIKEYLKQITLISKMKMTISNTSIPKISDSLYRYFNRIQQKCKSKINQSQQNQMKILEKLEKEKTEQENEIHEFIYQLSIFVRNKNNFSFIFEMMQENDKIQLKNQIQADSSTLQNNINDLNLYHQNSLSEIIRMCNKILPQIEKYIYTQEIKEYLNKLQTISNKKIIISDAQGKKISDQFYTYFNKIQQEYKKITKNQAQNDYFTPTPQPFENDIIIPQTHQNKNNLFNPYEKQIQYPQTKPIQNNLVQPYTKTKSSDFSNLSTKPTYQKQVQPYTKLIQNDLVQPYTQPIQYDYVDPYMQPIQSDFSNPFTQPSKQNQTQPFIKPIQNDLIQPYTQPRQYDYVDPYVQPIQSDFSNPFTQPSKQNQIQPSIKPIQNDFNQRYTQPIQNNYVIPQTKPISNDFGNLSTQQIQQKQVYPSIQQNNNNNFTSRQQAQNDIGMYKQDYSQNDDSKEKYNQPQNTGLNLLFQGLNFITNAMPKNRSPDRGNSPDRNNSSEKHEFQIVNNALSKKGVKGFMSAGGKQNLKEGAHINVTQKDKQIVSGTVTKVDGKRLTIETKSKDTGRDRGGEEGGIKDILGFGLNLLGQFR